MNLIQQIRQFLKDTKIDYLLVNSTNEFLVEYSELSENARYFLTNFSGSTGDAVISQKDVFLFVDGRYHEQADSEVDKNIVTVVKMKIGESFVKLLETKVEPNKTFAVVSKKNSQGRLEILKSTLKDKNIKFHLLDSDPVIDIACQNEICIKENLNLESIDIKIAGRSADEKFNKISENLKPNEGILITNLEEISYLCNLRDFSKNYSSKILGKCIIDKKSATLFTDALTDNIGQNFNVLKLKDFEKFIKNSKNLSKIYVDKTSINAYDYALLGKKVSSLKINYIKEMKSVKTDAEIAHYKKCFERTDKALMETREFIEKSKSGQISECDIAKNLEENFYKFEAKSLSFKSIVAKDKNSALAHYSKCAEDEILTDGSLILIDCGAYYEGGYATDITRVFVMGEASNAQKEVYTTVLKGFLKAFNKKITPKTSGFILDKAARKILTKIAPEGFEFSHSLGHGIGINVHESPPSLAFSPLAKTALKPNMCFTIEPGLYKKGFGGVRLENSCYLDKEVHNGDEKLIVKSFTNMCFEKKLIDYNMLSATEKKQLKNFEVK